MEFLNLLEEAPSTISREHHEELFNNSTLRMTYEESGFRAFYPLRINDAVSLSIQGSFGHYATPRRTLPKEEYQSMEMAILFEHGFSNVNDVLILKDNQLAKRLEMNYDDPIYSYVPVADIEALYQELKQWEQENASK